MYKETILYYCLLLSQHALRVYATNIDKDILKLTRLAGNYDSKIHYFVSDATRLPLKGSSIEFIWRNQVIEHIKMIKITTFTIS